MPIDEYDNLLDSLSTPVRAPNYSAPTRTPKGALRYVPPGSESWSINDAGKIKDFYRQTFNQDLPIASFGQGNIHNRWGYDHRNAFDVSLAPSTSQGQALIKYLQSNNVPFQAFDRAVPGAATAAHIHVGMPSHHTTQTYSVGTTLGQQGRTSQPTGDEYDQLLDGLSNQSATSTVTQSSGSIPIVGSLLNSTPRTLAGTTVKRLRPRPQPLQSLGGVVPIVGAEVDKLTPASRVRGQALSQAVDLMNQARTGLSGQASIADVRRSDDNPQATLGDKQRIDEELAGNERAQVANEMLQQAPMRPLTEKMVDRELARRHNKLDESTVEGISNLISAMPAPISGDLINGQAVQQGFGDEGNRLVREGALRSVGGTLMQVGNLTGGIEESPLTRAGRTLQKGVQRSIETHPAESSAGALGQEVVRGVAGLPLEYGKLAAGSELGALNLPFQGVLSDPDNPVGAAAKGALYHYGMGATAPLGRVLNGALWTAIPTAEGVAEGKSLPEALGSSLPMGLLAATGESGIQARERFFREKGFEPIVIKSESGETASVYVNPETGWAVSRKIANEESRPNRPVVEVGKDVFDNITGGRRINVVKGTYAGEAPTVESEGLGATPAQQPRIGTSPRQIEGQAPPEPTTLPTVGPGYAMPADSAELTSTRQPVNDYRIEEQGGKVYVVDPQNIPDVKPYPATQMGRSQAIDRLRTLSEQAQPKLTTGIGLLTARQKWNHLDFGLVSEVDNQNGVPRGSVRVVDRQGAEHIIQRSNGRGQGNNRAIPVRGENVTEGNVGLVEGDAQSSVLPVSQRTSSFPLAREVQNAEASAPSAGQTRQAEQAAERQLPTSELSAGVVSLAAKENAVVPASSGKIPAMSDTEKVATASDADIQKALRQRRVKQEAVDDAIDLAGELRDAGAEINKDGTVTLYHRTTPEKAQAIKRSRQMTGDEDGVFFSTHPQGQAEGYGDTIVKTRIPIEQLELDDVFDNEAHLRVPLKRAGAFYRLPFDVEVSESSKSSNAPSLRAQPASVEQPTQGESNAENTNPLSSGRTNRGSVDAVSSEGRVPTDIPPKVEVGAHGRFTHLLHKSYPHPETGKSLPAFLTEPSVRKAVGLPEVSSDEAKTTVETQKVRDAIAKRMRAPRSSYLGVNGFQRFIDIHKNSLSNDAIDAYHATVLEHENYSQKLDGFLTHPIVDRILSEAQNGQIQRGAKTQLAQIAKQFGVSKASADAALDRASQRRLEASDVGRGSVEPKESTSTIEPSNRRTESSLRRPASSTPESTETKPSSITARRENQNNSIEQKKSALLGLLRARDITRAEYDRRLSALNSGQDINVVTGSQSKISRFGAKIRNFLENEQGSASLTRGDRSINIITGRPGMRVPTAEERKALKIPPAWADVKIDDSPDARLIAIGKDTKGRTQRIYSAAHSDAALVAKFIRQREFNTSLPRLMERIHQDLNSRNHEEASVLRLIAMSGFRVGGEGDTGAKIKAYGASTLRTEHVKIEGDTVHFDFIGKLGVRQQHSIKDAGLAEDLQARLRRGDAVFQTNDTKVRNYLHSISEGKAYKVHDFRTWNATETARRAIENIETPATPEEYWAKRDEVGDIAAAKIGDTRVIALESYIDPLVFEDWRERAGVEENATRPKQTRRKAGDVSRTNETNERTLRDQSLRQRGSGEELSSQREQVAVRQLSSSPRQSEAGFLNVSDLIKTFIFDPTRTMGGTGTKAIENTVAYIRAALLSNIPATPIKAAISLTAKAAIEEGVRPLSSLIDRAASKVLSMPRVVGGWHSRAMSESFVKTLKMGLPDAWKIMRGQTPTTPGAHNFPGVRTRFPLFDASVNTVTRIYGAKAAIFYTRAFYSEITQQAILQANKMIKSGSLAKGNRKQFIDQFINTPPPQSQILASQIAMRNIYMNENLASDITTGIKNGLTKAIPSVGRLIGHAMIPIDRVPSNAAIDLIFSQPIIGHAKALFQWKQAVDFMNKALSTTNPRLAQDFTAAARVAQHEAAQTFAKASTIGALFILVGAMLAARGDAVSDKYDKRVRVPRTDYTASLIPFGLPGMLTGLGASMYQNMKGKDLSGMWQGLKASEKEALRDIPVIRELSDLASEDKSKPKPIFDSAARLLIPQGIQSIGNLTDDVKRTPQTNIQAIEARLPVLRRNVPVSKYPEDKYKLFDPFKVRKEEARSANRASGAPPPVVAPTPPPVPKQSRRTVN